MSKHAMITMKRLTPAVLLLAAFAGNAFAAAGTVALQDDFSQDTGWSAPDKNVTVAFDKGQLSFTNSDANLGNTSVTRSFLLSPAASYEVSVDIAVTRQTGKDAFSGIELNAPFRDSVGFVLSPKDKNVMVVYWRRGEWAKALLPWTFVAAVKSEPGAVNTLTIESKAGAFVVSVNNEVVGRTKVIDFSPTSIGLGGGDVFSARYDNLRVTETGLDSRQARFLMLKTAPGQSQLAYDNFTSYSGVGKLLSLTKKRDDKPDWGKFWNNDDSRAAVDASRQRMVIETKNAEKSAFITIASYSPLRYAGVSVGARLVLPKLAADDDCAGVMVEGRKVHNDDRDVLLACVSQSQAMLTFYDTTTEKWRRLSTGKLAVPNPSTADIQLVINSDQVLMFVDGRLHATADRPADFEYYTSGIRLDPAQLIEVLEFNAAEI